MRMIVALCALLGLMLGGCAAKTSGAEPESEPTPTQEDADGGPATPAPEEPTAGGEEPTDGGEEEATAGEGETDVPDPLDAESACEQVDPDLPLEERCAAAGAVVHTFPNTCVGGCKAKEEMMMCGQAMTEGCLCPEGQCIDEQTGCCREIRK